MVVSPNQTYFVAGARVTSNREAAASERVGPCEVAIDIRFVDLPAFCAGGPDCYHLPGPATCIAGDGRSVSIAEEWQGMDYAAQIRRVVPLASSLQGQVVLHASAVISSGGVNAFIAESGAGKSTLAAALSAIGHAPAADDLIALQRTGRGVCVLREGRPALRAVFFLERGDDVADFELTPLSPLLSLRELASNGFGELPSPAARKAQFEMYCAIANSVPAYRLRINNDLPRLPEIARRFSAEWLGKALPARTTA